MRERLIELLNEAREKCANTPSKNCKECSGYGKGHECINALIADYLLADGWTRPPCKVGDEVFVLTYDSPTGIEESRVKRIELKELQDGTTLKITIPCVYDDWGDAVRTVYPEDFGKTVFLTREGAEAALRKEDEGK